MAGELSDRDDYEVCPSAPICTGLRWCRHCSRRGTCGATGGSPFNYPKPCALNPKPYPGAPMLCERPTREVDWGRCDCSACSRVRACIPVALRVRTLVQVKLPCRTEHTNTSGDDAES